MANRKKMGMFDHAKYSKPVLRNIPEPVQRAVKRDINKLLDYGAAAVRSRQPDVVEDSFEQQQQQEEVEEEEQEMAQHQCRKKFCPEVVDLDKPPIIWASSFRPPEKSLGLGRDPSFAAVREALLRAAPARERESPKMAAEQRLAMLLNPYGTRNNQQQCTPVRRCSDETPPAKPLRPSKCPLDRLAARLMDSFPSITLKDNEPLTLTDATFSMAKRALLAAQERNATEENDARGDCSATAPPVDLNPLKSISDQTVCFLRTSAAETGFSDDHPREMSMDESPTADIFECEPISSDAQYSDRSSNWIWNRSAKASGEVLVSHFSESLFRSPAPESMLYSPVPHPQYSFDSPF